MKFLVSAFVLFFVIAANSLANDIIDVIVLKDSTVIEGMIIEQIPGKTIKVRYSSGSEQIISFNKIDKIYKKESAEFDYYYKNYTEIGVNLGTPAAFNFLIGRWFSPVGISISGMKLGKTNGLQGNFRFKLADRENICHSLALIMGVSNLENKGNQKNKDGKIPEVLKWSYYGLAYNMNWNGFWAEIGLSGGNGDYTSPQLLFQIGYTHRFIRN